MITEQQQEQAARFALGELDIAEHQHFAAEVRANPELREFLWSLQRTLDQIALAATAASPAASLKEKVLRRVQAGRPTTSFTAPQPAASASASPGLRFLAGSGELGWKALPVPGAFIKLLSFQPDRGYAVLLGKLAPGARYPAHTNAGPEDFYVLTGDLHIGEQVLGPGDFHHADAGSIHEENHSVAGCTLLAVLSVADPIVQLALA